MLLYLRAALSARNEGSQAIFSLERETAAKRVYSSSGMIFVLLLIVVGVYALSNYVELPPANAERSANAGRRRNGHRAGQRHRHTPIRRRLTHDNDRRANTWRSRDTDKRAHSHTTPPRHVRRTAHD